MYCTLLSTTECAHHRLQRWCNWSGSSLGIWRGSGMRRWEHFQTPINIFSSWVSKRTSVHDSCIATYAWGEGIKNTCACRHLSPAPSGMQGFSFNELSYNLLSYTSSGGNFWWCLHLWHFVLSWPGCYTGRRTRWCTKSQKCKKWPKSLRSATSIYQNLL